MEEMIFTFKPHATIRVPPPGNTCPVLIDVPYLAYSLIEFFRGLGIPEKILTRAGKLTFLVDNGQIIIDNVISPGYLAFRNGKQKRGWEHAVAFDLLSLASISIDPQKEQLDVWIRRNPDGPEMCVYSMPFIHSAKKTKRFRMSAAGNWKNTKKNR